MQKQAEYNEKKDKLKDNLIVLRIKDQRQMDTKIVELENLTLMQRIRRKQFNKILNEMREQNQNKLQLPNLEE